MTSSPLEQEVTFKLHEQKDATPGSRMESGDLIYRRTPHPRVLQKNNNSSRSKEEDASQLLEQEMTNPDSHGESNEIAYRRTPHPRVLIVSERQNGSTLVDDYSPSSNATEKENTPLHHYHPQTSTSMTPISQKRATLSSSKAAAETTTTPSSVHATSSICVTPPEASRSFELFTPMGCSPIQDSASASIGNDEISSTAEEDESEPNNHTSNRSTFSDSSSYDEITQHATNLSSIMGNESLFSGAAEEEDDELETSPLIALEQLRWRISEDEDEISDADFAPCGDDKTDLIVTDLTQEQSLVSSHQRPTRSTLVGIAMMIASLGAFGSLAMWLCLPENSHTTLSNSVSHINVITIQSEPYTNNFVAETDESFSSLNDSQSTGNCVLESFSNHTKQNVDMPTIPKDTRSNEDFAMSHLSANRSETDTKQMETEDANEVQLREDRIEEQQEPSTMLSALDEGVIENLAEKPEPRATFDSPSPYKTANACTCKVRCGENVCPVVCQHSSGKSCAQHHSGEEDLFAKKTDEEVKEISSVPQNVIQDSHAESFDSRDSSAVQEKLVRPSTKQRNTAKQRVELHISKPRLHITQLNDEYNEETSLLNPRNQRLKLMSTYPSESRSSLHWGMPPLKVDNHSDLKLSLLQDSVLPKIVQACLVLVLTTAAVAIKLIAFLQEQITIARMRIPRIETEMKEKMILLKSVLGNLFETAFDRYALDLQLAVEPLKAFVAGEIDLRISPHLTPILSKARQYLSELSFHVHTFSKVVDLHRQQLIKHVSRLMETFQQKVLPALHEQFLKHKQQFHEKIVPLVRKKWQIIAQKFGDETIPMLNEIIRKGNPMLQYYDLPRDERPLMELWVQEILPFLDRNFRDGNLMNQYDLPRDRRPLGEVISFFATATAVKLREMVAHRVRKLEKKEKEAQFHEVSLIDG